MHPSVGLTPNIRVNDKPLPDAFWPGVRICFLEAGIKSLRAGFGPENEAIRANEGVFLM
jgi:hypothetical protein